SLKNKPIAAREPSTNEVAPKWIQDAVKSIKEHLNGKTRDFSKLKIDYCHATPYQQEVYEAAREIKPGTYLSYKQLSEKIGRPKACRAVGSALGKNPVLLLVPCHRVLTSSNKLGGFSAEGGIATKKKLLILEGVKI